MNHALAGLAFSIILLGLAQGEIWVVSQGESIQEMIDLASPGDTIQVEGGNISYNENLNLSKPLTLQGVGMPILDCGGYGSSVALSADGIVLEGFVVTNYSNSKLPEEAAGIILHSNNNIIRNNVVYNGGAGSGISLNSSDNNSIEGNNVTDNRFGISLSSSDGNSITGNDVNENGDGIRLQNSENNAIEFNNISFSTSYGIGLNRSNNNKIKENNIRDGKGGIYLLRSDNNTIIINFINNSATNGIELKESDYNNVGRNSVSSNTGEIGIYLDGSHNNTLVENNASFNNDFGIKIENSNDNTITDNNASFNTNCGIVLEDSMNNTLQRNLMTGNDYNFDASEENDVDTSNRVDGNAVYYLVGSVNMTIDSSSDPAGTVYCLNCNNITIKDQDFNRNGYGIRFTNTTNSTVVNNTFKEKNEIKFLRSSNNIIIGNDFSDVNEAVTLLQAHENTIADNFVTNNHENGFRLEDSWHNILINNSINNDGVIDDVEYGIELRESSYNTINGNTVSSIIGFYLEDSHNNTFIENNASKNGEGGFYIDRSNDNILTGNNFSYNNEYGIFIDYGYNNIITKNNASFNGENGIYIYKPTNYTIINNNVYFNEENGFKFESGLANVIAENNAKNNKNGFVFKDSTGDIVFRNKAGQNDYGMILDGPENCTIVNNSFDDNNENGLYLVDCRNNTLASNVVVNNSGCGIAIIKSLHNNLTNNSAYDNLGGIALRDSSHNKISSNWISNNQIGVYLTMSNRNDFKYNYINKNYIDWAFNLSEDNTIEPNLTYGDNIYYNTISNDTILDQDVWKNLVFLTDIERYLQYNIDNTDETFRDQDITGNRGETGNGNAKSNDNKPDGTSPSIGKSRHKYTVPDGSSGDSATSASPTAEDYQKMAEKALGMVGWDPPREMIVRHKYKINVTLGEDRERLAGYLEEEYAIYQKVNLSPKCVYEVNLTGDNFDISLKEGLAQQMYIPNEEELPKWVWEVTPTKGGNQTLKLVVNYQEKSNIGEPAWATKKRLDEWPVTVTVEEKTASDYLNDGKNFIKKYWQWLATVLIIPIVKWWMGKRRSLKKEKPGPTQEMAGTSKGPSDERPPGPGGGET